MRTLAFDGRMGASGDMLLGALIAAGGDPNVFAPVEDAIDVRYEVGETVKNGIVATTVDVLADVPVDESDHPHGHDRTYDDAGDHNYDPDHDHDHDHNQGPRDHDSAHDDASQRVEGSGPLRTYPEVVEVVESMTLPSSVESDALAVFRLLGEAEAAVHGTDLDGTHFHEVGADDAIADVVGSCLLVRDLDVERVVTTPLATGGGEVSMDHGRYPVPVPAVVELATRADWSLAGGPVEVELLTPTGAAILAHYAEGVEHLPPLRVRASGYGAGGYDFPDRPNVLRALVGDGSGRLVRDEITVLETNLDDASPEVLGGLQETLTAVGARDVTVLPATMKKSRPGHLVKVVVKPEDAERVARRLAEETGTLGLREPVVVKPEDAERVARRLAEETGTLGIREHGAGHRWIAERTVEVVDLEIDGRTHEVAVKIGRDAAGTVFDVSAEYDDALAVALETDLAVREVMRRVQEVVREKQDSPGE